MTDIIVTKQQKRVYWKYYRLEKFKLVQSGMEHSIMCEPLRTRDI